MKQPQELLIKSALDTWYSQVSSVDKLLETLTDAQLQKEVSPNKNRGIYLLGHLVAVHDRLLSLLNLGTRLHPELDEAFITNPDNAAAIMPSLPDLRYYWKEVNDALAEHFNKLTPDEWFQKHNSVSEEDFAKEPHRNRLAVLINRATHLSYHSGQLVLLKMASGKVL